MFQRSSSSLCLTTFVNLGSKFNLTYPKNYATAANQQPKPSVFTVFNRETKKIQRNRASTDIENSRQVDYLKDEIAYRMVDRLLVKIILNIK